jgi:hypothetical protein
MIKKELNPAVLYKVSIQILADLLVEKKQEQYSQLNKVVKESFSLNNNFGKVARMIKNVEVMKSSALLENYKNNLINQSLLDQTVLNENALKNGAISFLKKVDPKVVKRFGTSIASHDSSLEDTALNLFFVWGKFKNSTLTEATSECRSLEKKLQIILENCTNKETPDNKEMLVNSLKKDLVENKSNKVVTLMLEKKLKEKYHNKLNNEQKTILDYFCENKQDHLTKHLDSLRENTLDLINKNEKFFVADKEVFQKLQDLKSKLLDPQSFLTESNILPFYLVISKLKEEFENEQQETLEENKDSI